MKTRVKYYNGWYYPQVKGLFFWKHILELRDIASFRTMDEAIEYIVTGDWNYNDKVVWSSK